MVFDECPKIKKISSYGLQIYRVHKDPYEPFVNPRDIKKDISSNLHVFSVTVDLTLIKVYNMACEYWKIDPKLHVLTNHTHSNLQILMNVTIANYFHYEKMDNTACMLFISPINLQITNLMDN